MKKRFKIGKLIKWVIIIGLIAVAGLFIYQKSIAGKSANASAATQIKTGTVEKRDVINILSSSGTIEPIDKYEVTTLVEGEIIEADFNEGDIVNEGQILYKIATDTLDSEINKAEITLERAKNNYDKAKVSYTGAVEDYNDAQADYKKAAEEYSDVSVEATETGIVKKLLVEVGDTIQAGAQIAEIYDNSSMQLTIPFSAADVDNSLIGKKAEVTISDTFESIEGTVTEVSSIESALSGNRVVKDVTIEVVNPGGLSETTKADAAIGTLYSMASATFAVKTDEIITSDLSGEIAYLNIEKGQSVKEGDIVLVISEDTVDDKLDSYLKAIDSAQDVVQNAIDTMDQRKEAIEDAESSLKDIIDNRTDYSITAPVTGKVIKKEMLKGETIDTSNMASALCTIYDLSSVTFDMYIDELDVLSVEVGQNVTITADALPDTNFTGVVTNVSLESTSSNGVTQYPVTVRIDDFGRLLPGMNVTGEIKVKEVADVLAVPGEAVQRGDLVFVKSNSATAAAAEPVVTDILAPEGYTAVPVKTGISDGDYVEIISGLSEGDEIFLGYESDSNSIAKFFSTGRGNGGQASDTAQPAGGQTSEGNNTGGNNSGN